MISCIEYVSIGVGDADDALRLFRDEFGFYVERDTIASESLLLAWRVATKPVRIVELSYSGSEFGRVRLLQFPKPFGPKTRSDFGKLDGDPPLAVGPKSLALYVKPPLGTVLTRAVHAGCVVRSERVRFYAEGKTWEEVMVSGPGDVRLLLIEDHRDQIDTAEHDDSPARASEVMAAMVMVDDPVLTQRFYAYGLGLEGDAVERGLPDEQAPLVCRLIGCPEDRVVRLMAFRRTGHLCGKILAARLEGAAPQQLRHPMQVGNLGISLFSLRCSDLDALGARLKSGGFSQELNAQSAILTDGSRTRLALVRGPNGELLEIVER